MYAFFADHIWQFLAAGAGFGAIGVAVLLFFVGVPAIVLIGHMLQIARAIVEFLKTPLGQLCGVIVLCVVVAWIADINATRRADARWKALDLKAQADKQALEASIARDSARDAATRLEQLTKEDLELKQKVSDYEKANVHDRACVIGDRARRLRDIAGQPEARDTNSRQLRKPGKTGSGP